MASTTLTGTTGNNLLNAPGSVSTLVQGLAGNDTINLILVNDEADGGEGNDRITLTASGTVVSTVNGGAGNDTVNFSGATLFQGDASLGDGADSIAIAGTINSANVSGNQGNDTIALTNSMVSTTIGAGQGNDLLKFTGAAASLTTTSVFGGKGKDTIYVQGATTASFASINGAEGADLISLTGAGALANTIVGGGKFNDSIVVGGNAVASVAGGAYDDTIRLLTGFDGGRIYGDAVGVTTAGSGTGFEADGNDSISVLEELDGATSIYGGGGNDTINFLSGLANIALVNGGDGNDSIGFVGSAAGTALLGSSIFGGAGADSITLQTAIYGVTGVAGIATIYGGEGADTITYQGTAGDALANSYDQATISALTGVSLILNGVSGDSLVIGNTVAITTNTQQNWAVANPSIFIASSLSAMSAALSTLTASGAGSIAVFSDGTDTVIGVLLADGAGGVGSSFAIVVEGADLVTATTFGATTLVSSNFGFAVSAAGGNGLKITFS